jgi:hypothetical protein
MKTEIVSPKDGGNIWIPSHQLGILSEWIEKQLSYLGGKLTNWSLGE